MQSRDGLLHLGGRLGQVLDLQVQVRIEGGAGWDQVKKG
jgi:hypothetical protein